MGSILLCHTLEGCSKLGIAVTLMLFLCSHAANVTWGYGAADVL